LLSPLFSWDNRVHTIPFLIPTNTPWRWFNTMVRHAPAYTTQPYISSMTQCTVLYNAHHLCLVLCLSILTTCHPALWLAYLSCGGRFMVCLVRREEQRFDANSGTTYAYCCESLCSAYHLTSLMTLFSTSASSLAAPLPGRPACYHLKAPWGWTQQSMRRLSVFWAFSSNIGNSLLTLPCVSTWGCHSVSHLHL